MNKRVKWIIVGAAAAVVLGGALVALKLTAPDDTPEETEEAEVTSRLMYEKKPEDLKKLTIRNETGEYEIVSDGSSGFTIEAINAVPLNSDLLTSTAEAACSVTIQDTVTENAEDMSVYGLAEPRAEVKAEFGDSANTVKEFLIGDVTPKSGRTYFAFKGENTVYTVKTTDVSSYLNKEYDYVQKTVFSDETDEEGNKPLIEDMIVSRRDIPYLIELVYDERQEDETLTTGNTSSHLMTSPVTLSLNPDTANPVLNALYGLTAEEAVVIEPTEQDLEAYGLTDDTCFGKLAMKLPEQIFKLTIGNEVTDDDGNVTGYYCYVNGFDVVYIFSTSSLPWATLMPLDITSTMVTSNYIYDLSSIEIKTADKTYDLEMTGSSSDDFTVKIDGKDIETDRFKTFYQFLLRTSAEELYLQETDAEPYLTITIKTTRGNTDVLEYIADSDRMTIIKLNGNADFRCRTAYTDRLLENLDALINGGEFATTW